MKKLLTITTLFLPALLFAQQKTGGFIKEHLYVKISPALISSLGRKKAPQSKGGDALSPAVFGAVGAKMRYVALGFSAGYFKFNDVGPVKLPLGIDVTITDFKKKKVFPVVTAQWYKAHSTEHYALGHEFYDIAGKDMFSIGAGLAFRVLKTAKIQTTLSYSKLNCNATYRYWNGFNTITPYHYKSPLQMVVFAVSILL